MAISTLFLRPVNLFRSPEVRAKSPHTSFWVLARLSNLYGGKNNKLQSSIENNLAHRMHEIKLNKDALDRFNTDTLVHSLEMTVIIPKKSPEYSSERQSLDHNAGVIHALVSDRVKDTEDKKGLADRLNHAFTHLSNPPFGSKKIEDSLIDKPESTDPPVFNS